MNGPAFSLRLPGQRSTNVLFASPHSGCEYPARFVQDSLLDEAMLRSSEDAFVDDLFDAAPDHGAPLLAARAPRAYVDLNRAADELDPALIAPLARHTPNPRVNSGLGVIPRVVAGGRMIHRGKIPRIEADRRLARVWHPYHAALQGLIDETYALFGSAILIDCHSMPHEAIDAHSPAGRRRPDVVLGDRFGASAGAAVVDRVEAAFAQTGLRVARNAPFAGAYTAQHYGRPSRGQHVVQVELDRALYMDERTLSPNANYPALKGAITQVIALLATPAEGREAPLAAE